MDEKKTPEIKEEFKEEVKAGAEDVKAEVEAKAEEVKAEAEAKVEAETKVKEVKTGAEEKVAEAKTEVNAAEEKVESKLTEAKEATKVVEEKVEAKVEAKAETKAPVKQEEKKAEVKAEAKPAEKKAEAKPAEKKTEVKAEAKPAEKKSVEKPAEKPAETKAPAKKPAPKKAAAKAEEVEEKKPSVWAKIQEVIPLKNVKNGLIDENPIFVQVLGMCPTLAVTTSGKNGLGMGLATTVVLMLSNLVISFLRNVIPDKVRIPAFIVVIASFVTVVDLLLQGFVPSLYASLGLFIPLIVVNCVILGRAEAYASKNKPVASLLDGLGMGLGFALALTILGSVREILGAGSVFGVKVMEGIFKILPFFESIFGPYQPISIMILAPGAFIALGIILAIFNKIRSKEA